MLASKSATSIPKERAESGEQTAGMCRGGLKMMKAGPDIPRQTTADSVDTVA